MKKFRRSIALFLSLTVVAAMFCSAGCGKNDPNGSASSSISSSASSAGDSSASASESASGDATGATSDSTAATSDTDSSTGETSGTTTSEPSETTAPDDGSSSGVRVHWDSYEPTTPKLPDPVVNWYYGEPKDDFIPAKDYGKIYFYSGFVSNPFSEARMDSLGCIDQNGRVICSPFVNGYYDNDLGGYYLIRHVNVDDLDKNKYNLIYQKIGYLSKDGSVYSGVNYDDKYTVGEVIHFVTFTDKGLRTVPFDRETGLTGDPIDLVFDYSKIPQNMSLDHITMDRYLVFETNTDVDYEDEREMARYIVDGKTGKVISTAGNQYIVGDKLLKEEVAKQEVTEEGDDWSMRTTYKYTLSDLNGNSIWKKDYQSFRIIGEDRILFGTGSGWELLDLEGNLIGSLRKGDQYIGGNSTYLYVEEWYGKIRLHVTVSTEEYEHWKDLTFDKDLHLIDTKEQKKSRLLFDTIRVSESMNENFETVTELENTKTGKTISYTDYVQVNTVGSYVVVTITKQDGDFYTYVSQFMDPSDFRVVKEVEGNLDTYSLYDNIILITQGNAFQLLDAKDLHVLVEREGKPRVTTVYGMRNSDSEEAEKYYVEIYKETFTDYSWKSELLDILDPSTGKSIFTTPLPDELRSLISGVTEIIGDKLFIRDDNFNLMIEINGNILFFQRVFRNDAEHYTDDSVWDGEADNP